MKLKYPNTRRVDHHDTLHGVHVADPYRWLEDTDSAETTQWISSQNTITREYLERIPERPGILRRLTELWNFERYGLPQKEGGRYFLFRNDGLQNQSVLYQMDSLEGVPRLLLDPNALSEDGTVALTDVQPSRNGRMLAYGLSAAGSDWQTWRVRDLAAEADLPDVLRWIKFSSVSWSSDHLGFFYSRYDEPASGLEMDGVNYNHKLYYHRLGDSQDRDQLIYERPDEREWGFTGLVTEDGAYLIISVFVGTENRNRVFYKAVAGGPIIELLNEFDAHYEFVGNDGPLFWFVTDLDAPRSRLIEIDTRQPERTRWREVIPQSDDTLSAATLVGGRFVASYLHDAHARVRLFDRTGCHVIDVPLPGLGTVIGFHGKADDPETFFYFTSFTAPGTLYRFDVRTEQASIFRQPRLSYDPSEYETRQVFFTSKDGTRVPMFISHRKDLPLDGDRMVDLYGYGGFHVAITPYFSVEKLVWMEMGGVFAVASIRGGSEYGESWHRAGSRSAKQNVFDDFIAAAEWLCHNGYTTPRRLSISGGSNGGLLVGACMTQRSDLFAAAVPHVGVMDMLRFHKFTIGWAWVSDYGSPDDPEDFRELLRYSPYHNLPPRHYPATLVVTGDHDDRVVPAHSFKFAAALQYAQRGDRPALIRVETRAGHGAGKPTAKLIEETADVLSFLIRELAR